MQTANNFRSTNIFRTWMILVAGGLIGILIFVISALNFRSDCIRAEQGIIAQYEDNQNNYSRMRSTIIEMAQVPAAYRDDLILVYESALRGRYGSNGSQAVFQFIQEHNPNVDARLYERLQTTIEAQRTQFSAGQTALIDRKRQYRTALVDSIWNGAYNSLFGFPRINLDRYGIVTSTETQNTFRTGRDEPINLRPGTTN